MIKIELIEAYKLYPYCEAFQNGGMVADDSPLRKKSEEIFQRSLISHMEYICSIVYRTIATRVFLA